MFCNKDWGKYDATGLPEYHSFRKFQAATSNFATTAPYTSFPIHHSRNPSLHAV